MNQYPAIKQVCKTPTKIYDPIDNTTILDYQLGVYIGREIDTKRNGLGVMLFKDHGIYYQGEWTDDKFDGRGFMANQNGDFYNGEWKTGLPHGEGVYVSSDNNWRYEGEWFQGKQQGFGEELFDDGSIFKGQYKKGQRYRKGKYTNSKQGYILEGQIGSQGPEGFATLQADDYLYEGEWKKGVINGTGRSVWSSNSKQTHEYLGQYIDGEKHGYGEYHDKEQNRKFKGKWKNGNMTNTGIFIEGNKNTDNK